MSASPEYMFPEIPDFADGIDYIGDSWPNFVEHTTSAAIAEGESAILTIDKQSVYQTLLGADALRYLTLQVT